MIFGPILLDSDWPSRVNIHPVATAGRERAWFYYVSCIIFNTWGMRMYTYIYEIYDYIYIITENTHIYIWLYSYMHIYIYYIHIMIYDFCVYIHIITDKHTYFFTILYRSNTFFWFSIEDLSFRFAPCHSPGGGWQNLRQHHAFAPAIDVATKTFLQELLRSWKLDTRTTEI